MTVTFSPNLSYYPKQIS